MEVGLVLVWLAMVLLLGLVALPLSAWLFPRGDSGAYAITTAIVTVGVVAHLVGHISYRWIALVAGVVVLLALSRVARKRVSIDRRGALEAAVVFVLTFLFIVAIRAIEPSAGTNPHWVGEMFLDFGLLNSLERADSLPPEDMWFAGEPVRYHYGGHLLTSLLAGLTLTPPAFAYNLGLATFFGMLATMAWGVANSIARPMAVPTRLAGALGVFFVAFAGNLWTSLRVLVWLLPNRIATELVNLVGADPEVLTWTPGDFFYWDSSRIIDRVVTPATEFPLFSWLHGDLHAHVLVKPLLLLVVALGVAYWYTDPGNRRRRALLLFGALPPVMGLIAVVNMWSVPIVAGLVAVIVLFSPGHPAEVLRPGSQRKIILTVERKLPGEDGLIPAVRELLLEGGRIGAALLIAIGSVLVSILWSAPYWWFVVLGGPGESIAMWDAGTPLGDFMVVQGAFILAITVYLGARLGTDSDRPLAIAAGLIAAILVFAILGWTVLGLVITLLLGVWWFLRHDLEMATDRDDTTVVGDGRFFGPEAMLLIAGLGIVLIVEVAKLDGDSFNSVFKPYADVWQLWAVALAVIAARLADGWPLVDTDRNTSTWGTVALVFVLLLVVSTGLYGILALPAHVEDGNSWSDATSQVQDVHGYTLDASAYVDVLYPEEAQAIEYLDDLEGQPTIATAVPSGYWWRPAEGDGAAAPASLTGVSTVLGWEHHERQYRGDVAYDERYEDVIELYTGEPATQREVIDAYDIDYIYVGPAEQLQWFDITIGDLPEVSVAAEFDEVTIYEVTG